MPVTATRTEPVAVGKYTLDADALAGLYKRARDEGKPFSLAGLADTAVALGARDTFLSKTDLERAFNSYQPSRLPPQVSEDHTPSVRSALQRAWARFKDKLEPHSVAKLPDNYGRVIVESFGGVQSPNETFVSAYVDRRTSDVGLKRLTKQNDVYFEIKKLGEPPKVYGPFVVDASGIDVSDTAPTLPDDAKQIAAALAKLPSQNVVKDALKLKRATFDYDATDSTDLKIYMDVSQRQAARLTDAQNQEIEKLAAYKSFGSQTPAVNDWLRAGPRGKNLAVTLLDQAFERAIALPEGMLLFRGFAADKIQGKRGEAIIDPAYLSASLDPGIARMFCDNAGRDSGKQKVLCVIECGPRAKGLFTSNRGETEVVLPRSLKLQIVNERIEKGAKKGDPSYLIVHLRTP